VECVSCRQVTRRGVGRRRDKVDLRSLRAQIAMVGGSDVRGFVCSRRDEIDGRDSIHFLGLIARRRSEEGESRPKDTVGVRGGLCGLIVNGTIR